MGFGLGGSLQKCLCMSQITWKLGRILVERFGAPKARPYFLYQTIKWFFFPPQAFTEINTLVKTQNREIIETIYLSYLIWRDF